MEDSEIIRLFFERDESAIEQTRKKCGKFIYSTAFGILKSIPDAEECENDAYLAAWNSIPPNRPQALTPYIGKITRRIAINRLIKRNAGKRGGGDRGAIIALDELEGVFDGSQSVEDALAGSQLSTLIDRFLRSLEQDERNIFMRRYWFADSIKDIAHRFGCSEGKIKMNLMRTRNKLKEQLEREGITV